MCGVCVHYYYYYCRGGVQLIRKETTKWRIGFWVFFIFYLPPVFSLVLFLCFQGCFRCYFVRLFRVIDSVIFYYSFLYITIFENTLNTKITRIMYVLFMFGEYTRGRDLRVFTIVPFILEFIHNPHFG